MMMTKKTALIIACNLMGEELDNIEEDYGAEARQDPYYVELQEAIEVLKQMKYEEDNKK